jgi:hypothetical protein
MISGSGTNDDELYRATSQHDERHACQWQLTLSMSSSLASAPAEVAGS